MQITFIFYLFYLLRKLNMCLSTLQFIITEVKCNYTFEMITCLNSCVASSTNHQYQDSFFLFFKVNL